MRTVKFPTAVKNDWIQYLGENILLLHPNLTIGKTKEASMLILEEYKTYLYRLPVFGLTFEGTARHSIPAWPTKNGVCQSVEGLRSTSNPLKTPHLPMLSKFLSGARCRQFISKVMEREAQWNNISKTFESVITTQERQKMRREEYQRRKTDWLIDLGPRHSLRHSICE